MRSALGLGLGLGLGLVLVVAACSPPPKTEVAPGKPDAAPAVVVVTPPSPSASAPPLATAAPPAPEPKDADLAELAKTICAGAMLETDGKVHYGCRKPPPFKGAGRAPDGKLVRHPPDDPMSFCGIAITAYGSFSAPAKKQALLTIDNCRDDSSGAGWNGSMPGSVAVIEQHDGAWKTVVVASGMNTGDCHVLKRADRRDTLVCQSRYDASSIGTMYYFFSLDFAGARAVARTLAYLYDDVENWMCMAHDGNPTMAPTGVTRLHVLNVTAKDINGDGTPDVAVEVERAHASPSPALETRLRALCKQRSPIEGVVPAATKVRLDLVSDGERFRPTPQTKALLDKWRAESPDVTQLEGTAPPKL